MINFDVRGPYFLLAMCFKFHIINYILVKVQCDLMSTYHRHRII